MKAQTKAKMKTKIEEVYDPLWEDIKKGLEDIKHGRLSVWKPRYLK